MSLVRVTTISGLLICIVDIVYLQIRVGSEWDQRDIMTEFVSNTWQILTQKWDGSGFFFYFGAEECLSFSGPLFRVRCPQCQSQMSLYTYEYETDS